VNARYQGLVANPRVQPIPAAVVLGNLIAIRIEQAQEGSTFLGSCARMSMTQLLPASRRTLPNSKEKPVSDSCLPDARLSVKHWKAHLPRLEA
jgi:hypothetical protein